MTHRVPIVSLLLSITHIVQLAPGTSSLPPHHDGSLSTIIPLVGFLGGLQTLPGLGLYKCRSAGTCTSVSADRRSFDAMNSPMHQLHSIGDLMLLL